MHVPLNWGLDVSHDIVNVEGVPTIDGEQDEDKPDDDLACVQSVGVIVISAIDLS